MAAENFSLGVALLALSFDADSPWYDGDVRHVATALSHGGAHVRAFVFDMPRGERRTDAGIEVIGLGSAKTAADAPYPTIGRIDRFMIRRLMRLEHWKAPFDIIEADSRFGIASGLTRFPASLIISLPEHAGRRDDFPTQAIEQRTAHAADGFISPSRDSAAAARHVYDLPFGRPHRVVAPLTRSSSLEDYRLAACQRIDLYREALALEGVHARTGMAPAYAVEPVRSRVRPSAGPAFVRSSQMAS
ncbi:MAG: hypothetical protein AAFW65_07190 [Pseudomonadota bacterium]